MAQRIDGKEIAGQLLEELREQIQARAKQEGLPCLAVVQVGEHPASAVYVRNKERACQKIGMHSRKYQLKEETTREELLELIAKLNEEQEVNGILVQLPLPKHLQEEQVILAIAPDKDVDGFHPVNAGRLFIGQRGYLPCTPAGIVELLKRSRITIAGKRCVIVGRSNIVGKPTALLLLREHATVTICHSRTENLKEITREADILIVAIGKPEAITQEYVKAGAVVVDVGIHRREDGSLCGDVAFEQVEKVAGAITPVPGGVGPMTVAMLMKNCVEGVREA